MSGCWGGGGMNCGWWSCVGRRLFNVKFCVFIAEREGGKVRFGNYAGKM